MALIAEETIESIFRSLDIIDLANNLGIATTKSGSNYKCKSPWADEKTASCVLSSSKQIFKDFSSGRGGTAISLIMQYGSGMSYRDALIYCANMYHIEVKFQDETPEEENKRKTNDELLYIMEAAKRKYVQALLKLPSDHPAKAYANKRFTQDELIQWGIGYAPDQWTFLTDLLTQKGLLSDGVLSGLIKRKDDKIDGKAFDFFRNRIMIPIEDERGRVVSFGARALTEEDTKRAKYLNGRDTLIYNKSNILFGLNHAAANIRKEGIAYLVEGYTDTISMHKYDINNTIASCGTSLTETHCQLIKRNCKHVVLLRDSDKAGLSATFRDLPLLLKEGIRVSVCTLPEGQDPDDFAHSLPLVDSIVD